MIKGFWAVLALLLSAVNVPLLFVEYGWRPAVLLVSGVCAGFLIRDGLDW